MKKRSYSKHLSILLVTALVVTSFPSYGFGSTVSEPNTTTTVPSLDLPQGYLLGELPAERERSIKHFLKDDGTYEAVVYPNPVHFLESGTWQDIDNSLTLSVSSDKSGTEVYKNKRNEFSAEFAKSVDSNKTLVMTKGDYRLEWGLEGASKSDINVSGFDWEGFEEQILAEITGTKDEISAETLSEEDAVLFANEKKKVIPNLRSEVVYQDVFPSVDLSYVIQSNQVKENLILSALPQTTTFTFNLALKSLVPTSQEEGSLWFCDPENLNEPVFIMQAPYMYDAKGEISNSVRMRLVETSSGYQVAVEPDMSWLKDESRVYPVTIDPPITTSLDRTDIYDAHVSQGYPTTNYQYSTFLKTGYGTSSQINRSYLKFTLPELSPGSVVTDAKLILYHMTTVSTPRQVTAHKVTESWASSTITWNKGLMHIPLTQDLAG